MAMNRNTLRLGGALDFFDFHVAGKLHVFFFSVALFPCAVLQFQTYGNIIICILKKNTTSSYMYPGMHNEKLIDTERP